MSDSVGRKDRVFAHALSTVKRIPRTGSARPPPSDRLRLYGLYKQSMEGDVEGVMRRPPDDAPDTEETRAEREKWDAWRSQSGLSRTAAKRAYISTLIATMHRFASSTPEARELVAELEFVWDQIKANSNVTSSGSSPRGELMRTEEATGMGYAGLGGSRRKMREDIGRGEAERIGLRVLRPVSDGDEGEYEDDDDEKDEIGFGGGAELKDLDIRNRKWRKRIENALIKTSTEVAALREQMESQRVRGRNTYGKSSGGWAWMRWLIWAATRQLLADVVMLGLAYLWARRKGNQKIEQGLWLVMQALKEQWGELRSVKL
ncbi:MAG: hypothetical protein LQ344_001183 [Seirophora lacunosa]|nr:MAG: hypothetical protein LQ344_001183 [Seirophora lacunosa]